MPRPGPSSHAERHEAWTARNGASGPWGPGPWGYAPGSGAWGDGPPQWRPPPAVTLWLPVVLAFLAQVPAAIWFSRTSELPPGEAALVIGLALVGPLALIGARRFPGPVVAIVALAAALDVLFADHPGPPYLALAFAVIGAIVRGARIWAWASVGAYWIATVTVVLVTGRVDWTPIRVALTTLGLLLVLAIGEGIAARRRRFAEYRQRASQRRQTAEQAERVRIGRELHDVIAHSLSQINVQAGVGLHLMDTQPEKAREALANIKETSKTSLDEVRSVLGLLRSSDVDGSGEVPLVPQPDLDRLKLLATGTGSIRVELDDRLEHRDIPMPVQSAVFRIVQESITNTVRHAEGAALVTVVLEREGDAVRVRIDDDGTGSRDSSDDGRGLLGMHERAELLGGTLEAGPRAGAGFRVDALLPLSVGGRP
jgi:signal transduction histidine kinase